MSDPADEPNRPEPGAPAPAAPRLPDQAASAFVPPPLSDALAATIGPGSARPPATAGAQASVAANAAAAADNMPPAATAGVHPPSAMAGEAPAATAGRAWPGADTAARAAAGSAADAQPPGLQDSPPLAARLSGDMRGPGLGVLLGALNHLLHQQQWARERLAPHAGRTLRMGVDPQAAGALPAPALAARIDEQGGLVPIDATAAGTADVTLWLRPSPAVLFDALRGGAQGLSKHLRIDGDVLLAGTLGELAQHLRWDPEEDLSRVVGDVAAHRLGQLARGLRERLGDAGSRMSSSALQFVTVEQPQLVQRDSVASFGRDVQALGARLDALAARVARLSART